MKRWLALPMIAALAWAAPVTTLYDQMAPALGQVKSLQANNPTQAFDVLAQAEDRFRDSASELPPALRDGVLANLAEAKQALYRKSQTDLEVRIILIKSILSKALYDGYFNSLQTQPQETSAYLSRMIAASGLPSTLESKANSLVITGTMDGLRTTFERAFVERMMGALKQASTQSNPALAYRAMVQAYASYLVIQDSQRIQGLSAKAFYTPLEKLTKSNLGGFKRDTQALMVQTKAILGQLNKTQAIAAKPTPKPAAANKPTAAKPVAAANPAASIKPAVATKPAGVPSNGVIEVKLANPRGGEIRVVTTENLRPAQATAQPTVASHNKLARDLGALLGNPQQGAQVAKQVSAAGIHSLEEWKRAFLEIEGTLLEAQVQSEMGDTDTMRKQLDQVNNRYLQVVAPVVGIIHPDLVRRTSKLLETSRTAVGLRTSDFSVIAGEILENRAVTEGKGLSTFHSVAVNLLQAIIGIPRAFLFILAGLLALFPLYLLALTFGGRNRYWQMLGVAFFFLLLPVMFEGLSYIGAVLSDSRYGKLSFLSVLNSFSIQQNIFAQLFWAISVFLVIVFAAVGLRGIATQFGLLQTRRGPDNLTNTSAITITGTTTGAIMSTSEVEVNKPMAMAQPAGAPTLTMETIVDWDEEF